MVVDTVTDAAELRVEAAAPAVRPEHLGMRVFSVVVLALVACVAVWHGWRKGMVLAPSDALQLVAPWERGEGYVARNEQLFDQTVQFVPWMAYTVERYRQGQIPLWNPHSQLGAPFVGNGQSAVFYPTILLHLKLPETWAWTVSAALRLFVAGLGAWVLAGRYDLRGVPRLLTGLAFMLCGFNVVWLNHPQMNVMPLLPWAILATELLITRVTMARVLVAAIVFALQFLGGHPATCIHLLLACAIVWAVRAVSGDAPPRAGGYAGHDFRGRAVRAVGSGLALAGAVAFGFALAAVQWLPLLEYARNSGASVVRQERLANERLFAFDPRYLIGVGFPYANGFPDGVAPFEMRLATGLPNTNELAAGFVGVVPLVLAGMAIPLSRKRRGAGVWMILVVVATLIAIRFPGVDHLVRFVYGLNVAQNARLLGVAALGLAMLAGMGLEALVARVRAGDDFARLRKVLGWGATALAGLALFSVLVLWAAKGPILNRGYAKAEQQYNASAEHEHSLEYVRNLVRRVHTELMLTGVRLLIPAAALGAAWALLWWVRRDRERGVARARHGGLWVCVAAAELLAFAIPFNPGSPLGTYFPPDVAAVQKLKELPPARFAGTNRTFAPETSTPYGLHDVRGYDALGPIRYYRWWAHPGIGALRPELQGYLSRLENPEHSAWGLLNFGYLVTAVDQPAPPADKFALIEDTGDAKLYRAAAARPRAWVAPRAEVYATTAEVLDRVAKMDFNPDQVVLLDKEHVGPVPEAVWKNGGGGPLRAPGGGGGVQLLAAPTPNDDRPEVVNLRVSGGGGGYLILADQWFPGWVARVSDPRTGASRETPILPAYGVLRAVPLPAAAGTVRVEMRYRPWSFRIGAITSIISVCLLLVLAGAATFESRGRMADNEVRVRHESGVTYARTDLVER
jgi:hypothetical protein